MASSRIENLRKVYERAIQKDMNSQQAALLYALQVSPAERQALFEKIAEWVFERTYKPKDGKDGTHGRDGKDGAKGEKGDKGDPGHTPTAEELLELIEPLIPYVQDGSDGNTPGRDELAAIIRPMVQEALSAVPQAPQTTSEQLEAMMIPLIEKKANEFRKGWFGGGGGGDLVGAGTGVTITTNNIGRKIISASGSGAFSVVTVNGTIDDSNTSFTAASEPTLLCISGAFYQKTGGAITWSYAGGTITLSKPIGTNGSIFGIA